MRRIIIVAVSSLVLFGCTSIGKLETNAAPPSNKESVFVLGVTPDNFRVAIFPGDVKEGVFHQNPWLNATFLGTSDDGFIVGKASVGTTLAITNVRVVRNKDDLLGADFIPCGNSKTVTFTLTAGVNYLGHLRYSLENGLVQIATKNDFADAKSYLGSHYPHLAEAVKQGTYDLLPTAGSCSKGTIYVPIYVGSHH